MQSVLKQIERLKKVYDIKSDTSLASALSISKNTVCGWKTRNSLPMDIFKKVSENENISIDWLISGNGSMHLSGDSIRNIIGSTLGRNDVEVSQRIEKLLEDQETREMIELLPYASKEFIESVKNRLEEFKKLSKI